MKKIHTIILSMAFCLSATAQTPFSEGRLTVTPLSRNAVRIQYAKGDIKSDLPEWLYVKTVLPWALQILTSCCLVSMATEISWRSLNGSCLT